MAITDSTGTFNSGILIGDPIGRYPATPTLFNNVPISSVLELKSLDKALTLTRMSSAELEAIVTPIDGMIAYNTDISAVVCRSNGIWVSEFSTFHTDTVIVTRADMLALNVTPKQLLDAPAAGKARIILKATFVNIFNTAAFTLGNDVTVGYADGDVNALSSVINPAFFRAAATSVASLYGSSGGTVGDIIAAADINTKAIEMTTDTAFTGGNVNSAIQVNIWYTDISVA